MLGGDKTFNDRLSWVLVLPLAGLALWASEIACMAVELVLEGDAPGSARPLMIPVMSLVGGWAAVLAGAKVAPARKGEAAAVLAGLYLTATLASSVLRWRQGAGAAWCAVFAGCGAAGCAVAVRRARKLPDDDAGDAPAEGAR